MAKKEKLQTDGFDFDTDFSFDDFDEAAIDGQMNPAVKKGGRKPIDKVLKGTLKGAKDKALDPSFIGSLVRKSLPPTYGEIVDTVDKVAGTASSLYDQAGRELKPQAARMAKRVDKLVPDEYKKTKKITGKIAKLFGAEDDSSGNQQTKEQLQDQSIALVLAQTFGEQNDKMQKMQAERDVENRMQNVVNRRVSQSSISLLSSIDNNITRLTRYNDKINQAFQKKGLEIQYRTLFEMRDMTTAIKTFSEVSRNQLEAITKNTSLPEFVKINNSERFKDLARTKFFDKVQNSFFGEGTAIDKGLKKIKSDVGNYISGIKNGLETASQGVDGLEQVKELNATFRELGMEEISGAELAGNAAGGWLAQMIGEKAVSKIKKKLDGNKKINDALYRGANVVNNLPGAIDTIQKSDKFTQAKYAGGIKGKAAEGADKLFGYFTDGSPDGKINNPYATQNNKHASFFNEKTQRSLVDIMPGYLARILREIQVLRTGDDKIGLTFFNHRDGKFQDKKELAASISKNMATDVKTSGYGFFAQSEARKFTDGHEVNDEQKSKVARFLSELSSIKNMEFTPENIQSTDAYRELDPETKKLVDAILDKKITSSDNKHKGQYEVTKNVMNLRNRTPDLRGNIESLINNGYGDILEDQGLVKRTADGGYQIDEKAYLKMVRDHSLVVSDETKKQDIHPLSPKRALNAVRKTGIFNWNYKKGQGDGKNHNGPMAQDVQKTMGNQAAPGGTKIDLTTMNGNNMSAIQELADRQDKLEGGGKKKGRPPLRGIKKLMDDVGAIRTAIEKSPFVGFGGGSGGSGSGGHDGSYTGMIGSLLGNVGGLISRSAGDAFGLGKKGVDKAGEMASKGYEKYKDPVKNGAGAIFGYVNEATKWALDFGRKTIFETVPDKLNQLKAFGMNSLKNISKWYNEVKDVYIPGFRGPVLRAALIRAGYYRDSVTGKIIESMDDLANLKGDVVDRAGKVVLSIEDAAKGMYDQYGETVKSSLGKLAEKAMKFGKAGFDRARDFWKSASEKGMGLFNSGKNKASELYDKAKKTKFDMPDIGMSFGNEKIYQVLVEIRGVLRGEDTPRHETLLDSVKKDSKAKVGAVVSKVGKVSADAKAKAKAKAAELKAAAKEKLNEAQKKLQLNKHKDQLKAKILKMSGGKELPFNIQNLKDGFSGLKDRASSLFSKEDDIVDPTLERVKPPARNLKQKPGKVKSTAKPNVKAVDVPGETNGVRKVGGGLFKVPGKLLSTGNGVMGGIGKTIGFGGRVVGGAGGMMNSVGKSMGVFGLPLRAAGLLGQGAGKLASGGGRAISATGAPLGWAGSAMTGVGNFISGKHSDEENQEPKKAKKKTVDKPAFNDHDGNGRRDGSWMDRFDKMKTEDAAKKAEKKDYKAPEAKYKSDKSIMDTVKNIGGIAKDLFSSAKGVLNMGMGAGKLLWRLGGGLTKTLMGGARAVGAVGGVAGRALGAVGSVVQGAGRLAGLGRLAGVANMARTALTVGSLMTGGVGSVIMGGLSALGAIVSSPVVLGAVAVAVAGYGIYKLYKYATRDNVDEYEDIRMKQYGIGTGKADEKYNHFMLVLEEYLQDGRILYSPNGAYLNDKKVKPEEMLEIFNIDKEDTAGEENFKQWFQLRFKPFFLTNITALYGVDQKAKLQDVKSLKPDLQLKFLNAIGFESGPYKVEVSPIKDLPRLNTNPDFALNALKNLIAKVSKGKQKELQKAKPDDAKPNAIPKLAPNANKPPEVPTKDLKANKAANSSIDTTPGEDGAMKDTPATSKLDVKGGKTSKSGLLKMADGPIRDGANGMQFVKLGKGVNIDTMNPSMLKNLMGMAQEYGEKTGNAITITSGTRTSAEQAELYRKFPGKAARPGSSMHEFGLAVDVSSGDLDQLDDMGLMRKYGFTRPVGGEPWHMEAAGIQTNITQAKKDSDFATMAVQSSLFKGGSGVGADRGSPLGKRDSAYAISLLDGSSVQEVKDRIASKLETSDKQTKDPYGNDSSSVPQTRTASNDNSYSQKSNVKLASVTSASYKGDNSYAKSDSLPDVEPKAVSSTSSAKLAMASDDGAGGDVKGVIKKVSSRQNVNPNDMMTFAAMESSLDPNAKAGGRSSAKGLYGFTDDTWGERVAKTKATGLSDNPSPLNPSDATIMASDYYKMNAKFLGTVKKNINLTDVYLAHFLGPGGARKLLSSDPSAIAANILPDAAAGNRAYFYDGNRPRTVAEFYKFVDKKLSKKAQEFGINYTGGASLDRSASTQSRNNDGPPTATSDSDTGGSSASSTQSRSTSSSRVTMQDDDQGSMPTVTISRPRVAPRAQTSMVDGDRAGRGTDSNMPVKSMDAIASTLEQSLTQHRETNRILGKILENSASLMELAQGWNAPKQEDGKKPVQGKPQQQGKPEKVVSPIDLGRKSA